MRTFEVQQRSVGLARPVKVEASHFEIDVSGTVIFWSDETPRKKVAVFRVWHSVIEVTT